jgi:hypothetical protein
MMPGIMGKTAGLRPASIVGRARMARMRPLGTRLLGPLLPVLLIALLVRPMVWGRTFIGWDWYPHVWYIWHQAGSLEAGHGIPSLFSYDTPNVFVPHYAFYGGTLYWFSGALSLLVGSPATAMVLGFVMAFAASYGGWYWLGRQAGLNRWLAHAPAVLFITSSYYLALPYATGGYAEFVALSMIPLLLAATWSILCADRLRFAPAAALAVSVTLYCGSHNLTLLWGTTTLAIILGVVFAAVPAARRSMTRAGLWRVARIAVPAVLVNAWFLLPNIAYQADTSLANAIPFAKGQLQLFMPVVSFERLVSLTRTSAAPNVPHLALQLPVLGLVWLAAGLVVLRSARRTPWYRTMLILLFAMAVLLVLMTHFSLLWGLGSPYNLLQFSYRLDAYIELGFAGAVVCGLALVVRTPNRRRLLAWALIAVATVSVVQAATQLRQRPPSPRPIWKKAAPYHTRAGEPSAVDYTTTALPTAKLGSGVKLVRFPVTAERGDRAEVIVDVQPGQYLRTNIFTMPELVRLQGARFVAREPSGALILQVAGDVQAGPARIALSAARPWPVTLGWVLTGVGFAALAANGAGGALGARRRRVA